MSCTSLGKSSKNPSRQSLLLLIGMVFATSACTYSFTNLQLHAPAGIHSIAIAPVYDTSRRILPHGRLWESLQREIIQSGKISLGNSTQADTQLRAHIVSAEIGDQDERRSSEKLRIPLREPTPEELAAPFSFEDLKIAESYTVSHELTLTVDVEIWDIRAEGGKAKLQEKRYTLTRRKGAWNEKIPAELRFIRAEESFDYLFAEVSDELARQIVTDFLSL
jgi:hypothetical protein